MATIAYKNASCIYEGSDKLAVDSLNLDISDGEFVVLVGPSGSGKSTALRMLAGLEDIDEGAIEIGGIRIQRLDRSHAREQRALMAGLDHRGDRIGRPHKQRLDRTVTTVSHPTGKTARRRGLRHPGPKSDPLHTPAHDYSQDRGAAHRISPVLSARAAFSPDDAQRAISQT